MMIVIAALFTASAVISLVMFKKVSYILFPSSVSYVWSRFCFSTWERYSLTHYLGLKDNLEGVSYLLTTVLYCLYFCGVKKCCLYNARVFCKLKWGRIALNKRSLVASPQCKSRWMTGHCDCTCRCKVIVFKSVDTDQVVRCVIQIILKFQLLLKSFPLKSSRRRRCMAPQKDFYFFASVIIALCCQLMMAYRKSSKMLFSFGSFHPEDLSLDTNVLISFCYCLDAM